MNVTLEALVAAIGLVAAGFLWLVKMVAERAIRSAINGWGVRLQVAEQEILALRAAKHAVREDFWKELVGVHNEVTKLMAESHRETMATMREILLAIRQEGK